MSDILGLEFVSFILGLEFALVRGGRAAFSGRQNIKFSFSVYLCLR